jgi:hypothetical protein
MIFGFLILLIAIAISVVAEYYSIMGLVALFAAATLPVIIMGASLGLGKVAALVWLHQNWARAGMLFKMYMVPAVFFLMFLTSMGIFGFLSKAHVDQGVTSGDVTAQVELIETKIATQRENINAARKVLTQMDGAVDQVLERSKNEQGARNANTLRNQQAKDREKLTADIAKAQTAIATLNEEKTVINRDLRKVEAEVGPVKYIAQMIYGDNPDANLLERAVRWVIILIVIVFDPLALVLILCATQQFAWARESRASQRRERDAARVAEKIVPRPEPKIVVPEPVVVPEPIIEPVPEPKVAATFSHYVVEDSVVPPEEKKTPRRQAPELTPVAVESPEPVIEPVVEPVVEEQPSRVANPEAVPGVNRRVMHSHLSADNAQNDSAVRSDFGNTFPTNPGKGDMYLRIDFLPNRLFKYNGNTWLQVDKDQTDVYAYDKLYIEHLISEIDAGKYEIDSLTEVEREQIKQHLEKSNGN